MSSCASYTFTNERARIERHQQLYQARLRADLIRLRARYRELVARGLDRYVADELQPLEQKLELIKEGIDTDMKSAAAELMHVETILYGLPTRARLAMWQEMCLERQKAALDAQLRQQQASSEFASFIKAQIITVEDPAVRDFALDGLRMFLHEYGNLSPELSELPHVKQAVRERMVTIVARARQLAIQWLESREKQVLRDSQLEILQARIQQLSGDPYVDIAAVRTAVAKLEELRVRLRMGGSYAGIEDEISQMVHEAEDRIVLERVREDTVCAITCSLERAGFVINECERINAGESEAVVVRASKSHGHTAEFSIGLDGGSGTFSNSCECETCTDDIHKGLFTLQEAYGIKLFPSVSIRQLAEPGAAAEGFAPSATKAC